MEVQIKPGYKQTEVGVIPEDWDVKSLDQLASIERGKFTARPRTNPKYYGGSIPFIQTGDVTNAKGTIKSFSQTLNAEGLRISKMFPLGTIFFTIAANIGDVAFADFETACPDSLVGIRVYKHINANWLAQELSKRKKEFENLATQNAQLNINLEKLKPYQIPVPTLAEQERIARALSDVDGLIEGLQRLIDKKKLVKQGAMQRLLNPYENGQLKEGWEIKRLGDVLKVCHGRSQHHVVDDNGDYPILATGGQIGKANTYLCSNPSVLIGRKGTIDNPQYVDKPFWSIDTLFYTEIVKPNNAKYLYYQFCLINWYDYNEASGVPSLSAKTVEAIEVSIPSPGEQEAIATTLSDMDAEIEALEQKLSKYRQIKQGMMQELLTGKTRLVASSIAGASESV
jgi:type I restriction enzyme S subunit